MPTILPGQTIVIDGVLADWTASQRIDYSDLPGYVLYGVGQAADFDFALSAPVAIGPNTTFWFDTDRDAATGHQIFGFAGGAEFNLNIKSDGTAALYTGGAGETLVLDNIQIAYSSDQTVIEFAIPKAALGDPAAMNMLYDVNDTVFGPPDYTRLPYAVYAEPLVRTNPYHKIGIVFSQTTEDHYFSKTAYAQLLMAVQSQAMQAGIAYDLLTEADLTNAAKLANYDALVFPSMANVKAADVAAITETLLRVTRQFGIGLVTAGNFLTNDETGAALPGDSYARMKLLFDATRVTGGFPADVSVAAGPDANAVFTTLAPGDPIHDYAGVAWDAFQSVSGNGQIIATETIDGQDYAAALATQTGGRNVLFSTAGVMADNNLLWQAIDHAAKPAGVQLSLELSRFAGIVASRTDMDQSMFRYDVSPDGGGPGIYDRLLPILAQWKHDYNFVGSYYVNIGDNPAQEETTDWSVSAPYYAQLLAMGNELGTHSYTHPENTNILTPAQLQFEFQQSKLVLEQQMSAYLGTPLSVTGAAVPGAVETLATAQQIIQYFNYMTGGYSGVGAGYPGAFGFLSPDLTNAVYLAPNTSFDFTLVEFQKLDPVAAAAAWAREWTQLVANANMPIVLWPWHDYGPTAWPTNPPNPSPYTQALFTDWIARAYASGAEFVTQADLAQRIQSFYQSGVTSAINGNVIDVTVTSPHAGDFALELSGLGGQVIQSVAGWYAYDGDSLFLPDSGGGFSITTGGTPDDVTHITALPMRADLLSVTGNGLDLSFSLIGEGTVRVELGAFSAEVPFVTGGTITGFAGDMLDITLGGIGLHTVSLSFQPAEAVATIALSADTGASASDFITNIAAQTLSGTLTAGLAAGDVVKISLDNGASWQQATADAGATTFTLADVTLAGSSTLIARVENARGVASTALSHGYTLDQQAPVQIGAIGAMTGDSRVAADFITNDGSAGRTMSGTLSAPLGADETLRVSADGGASWTTATAADLLWSAIDAAGHTEGWTIETQVVDLAGNPGPLTTQAVTLDQVAPAVPAAPALAEGFDTGASASDAVTSIAAPGFVGTGGEAGSTITLHAGAVVLGAGLVAADGSWSVALAAPLADGKHSVTATATDLAGNASTASATLELVIDSKAPATPATPDLATASDSGISATDNLTSINTPIFTGSAEAGSTVTLLDGGVAIGTGLAGADRLWSITAPTLADGIHGVTATATDLAGNVSLASAVRSVTIDTTTPPPSTPDMTAATDKGASSTDDITNDSTPTFTGSAEAGSVIALSDAGLVVGTATAGATGVWTITTAILGDGGHQIMATALDRAGNSGASAGLPVTIDTLAPDAPPAPMLAPGSDSGVSATDNLTSVTTPTFIGTTEAGATVSLYNGASKVGTGIADSDGNWSITSTKLATGLHSMTVKVTDIAGNTSLASVVLAVTIDTTIATPARPDLVATSDSGTSTTDNLTNIATPVFAGTAEAGSLVTLLDGGVAIGTATAAADLSWSITAAPLADGVHSIAAIATDITGNTSLTSIALAVTIDTAAPALSAPDMTAATDKGASSTDDITNDSTPTFTGTAEAGSRVTLYDAGLAVGAATANTAGAWTITTSVLADGGHEIMASAVDRAGNATSSAALPVTIDTLASAAPPAPTLAPGSDSGASATDNLTNITTPTFIGTAEAGATVALYNGASKVGTAVADADGAWSITSTKLSAGLRSMTVKVTDIAGNTSLASAVLAVTIDTSIAAPTRPDLVAASDSGASTTDNLTNIATPVFAGTAEAGSLVTLLDGGVAVGTATAAADRSWSITASPLADGIHSVAAIATDPAGNTGLASAALAVTIDTAAPAAPAFTGGTATSVTGTGEAGATVRLLDGAAVIGTGTVNAAGTWSIGFVASTAQRSLSVMATDRAGNAGAPSPGQVLLGTSAADSFAAGAADELFIGAASADHYAFGPEIGHDIIADFAAIGTAHDVIALNGIAGIASFADVLARASTAGTGVAIVFDADNSLTLNRVTLASLTAADFTFA